MDFGLDYITILTGIAIFFARVVDVSMGTLRTISIVQGRTKISFILGFFEVSMWLVVISTVISHISAKPILGIFYALGFSTGNVVGIILERYIAYGNTVLRIISPLEGGKMAQIVRAEGFPVTVFHGEGGSGQVTMLFIVCHRKDTYKILKMIKKIQPDVFYTIDLSGNVSKVYRPFMSQTTGWRSILKKK